MKKTMYRIPATWNILNMSYGGCAAEIMTVSVNDREYDTFAVVKCTAREARVLKFRYYDRIFQFQYFYTWKEAHDILLHRQRKHVAQVQENLVKSTVNLGYIRSMVDPGGSGDE